MADEANVPRPQNYCFFFIQNAIAHGKNGEVLNFATFFCSKCVYLHNL